MNYTPVIEDLSKQIEKLTAARSALLSLAGKPTTVNHTAKPVQGKSTITPEGRKRLAEMMRKRWAEKKRAAKKAAPKVKKITVAPKAS